MKSAWNASPSRPSCVKVVFTSGIVTATLLIPSAGLIRTTRLPVRSVTQSCWSGPQATSQGPSRPETSTRVEKRSGGFVTIVGSCVATAAVKTATSAPMRATFFIVRSLDHEGEQKDSNHHKRDADLDGHTDEETNPRCEAGFANLGHVAVHGQFAEDGAEKRSDDDAWQAQEQSEQRAKTGTDHRSRAGTELLRAQCGRSEVHEIARHADHTDQDQRPDANLREVIGPGRDDEPDDDQRRSRQRWQNGARQADDHQHDT